MFLKSRYSLLLLFFLTPASVLPACASPQTRLLDDFETLSGWNAIHSHGDAASIEISGAEGRVGKGMMIDFSFVGYMGSVSVEKRFDLPLPVSYQLSFDIRGDAPVNNLVVRLKDSVGNVWWVNRTNYEFSPAWTTFTVGKHQIQYGWGPSMEGELHTLDRIEIMIDVVNGGSGKVWIDNFKIEELDDEEQTPPDLEVSSVRTGSVPVIGPGGRVMTGWRSAEKAGDAWLRFDFKHHEVLGGLAVQWDSVDYPEKFDVLLSEDGNTWSTAYRVSRCNGGRSYVCLKDAEGRFLRVNLKQSARGKGYAINRLEIRGPDFSFSINEFFGAMAEEAPHGYFPKYLLKKQSYWTVVGAIGDTKEALINEEGMIETDKLSFSLEPFLHLDDRFVTWNDVAISHSLVENSLPMPSVRWDYRGSLQLTVTPVAAGEPGKSILLVKYTLRNTGRDATAGNLFVAVRPFQVNPPWQTFTIIGGAARIDSITCGEYLRVNDRSVFPLSSPAAIGAAEFDQGDVTRYLRMGSVPPAQRVVDHFGYASAAIQYPFDLSAGEAKEIVLAVPFHRQQPGLVPGGDDQRVLAYFNNACAETERQWRSKLGTVHISLPPSAGEIVNTIRSNLGYILINADGNATQPGSRSYERSWIRDGALTCTALLQMGIREEVRHYLDWYAQYQYPDGKIPCVVESRGPEPTPEHDSHGQFIYAVSQYFRFTDDTSWLRGKWPQVVKTVRYIQALRARRKTDTYKFGTPEQRACYGLVPESISHEGYSWKPQHSYWDNFFVVRGLKDAAQMAIVLGEQRLAKEFARERDDFRKDFYASIRMAMALKNIRYIPGCVELGDFSGLSTTIGITPCDELGYIPDTALAYTFDESYRQFVDRKNNTVPWDAYLPYDARFVGAYVFLDQKDRANDILQYLMRDRRPLEWNQWAEVVWKDRDAPKAIGDMPHSWAASDFIRSVRSMLVYERERDEALVIGAGIPGEWLDDPAGIEVRDLPTYYGNLSYSMKKMNRSIVVLLSGDLSVPPGRIVVKSPLPQPFKAVSGDGIRGPLSEEVVVDHIPARIELIY
jgi:Bacterial alpha-L-rhamnosidase 6 hairpin glycosidase domain/F5/8 type C domain